MAARGNTGGGSLGTHANMNTQEAQVQKSGGGSPHRNC